MKKVAVILLNWNGKRYLEKYLPSLLAYTPSSTADIYVADNASTDDSVVFLQKNYPNLRVLRFEQNYGFAEGYNIAIGRMKHEYVLLLNTDVEVTEHWLSIMLKYMDAHPKVAACQPKIKQMRRRNYFEFAGASGGFVDAWGYPFCRGRLFSTLEKDKGQYDTVMPVFWASGACMLIRRDDYEDYGGLDSSFFAHQEEIDLCWRLNARGRQVVVIPQSEVYHVGGGTLSVANPRKTYLNFRNNLLMLYKNVPSSRLWWLWTLRFLLDYTAAVVMLFGGKAGDAAAVVRARWDTLRRLPSLKVQRADNLSRTIVHPLPVQYRHSLLLRYHLFHCRKFSQLHF